MSKNKTEQAKILINAIDTLVESKMKRVLRNEKKKAVVQSLNADGTANIAISNEIFENVEIRAGLKPDVGEVVRVEIPNGSFKEMYIDTAKIMTSTNPDSVIWNDVIGRPTSSPSEIDSAVENKHSHDNKVIIDIISQEKINIWDTVVNKADKIHSHDTYTHNQTFPSAEWIINHNLSKMPTVTIVDSAGNVVIGETQYVDENQISLTFMGEFSGKAYLN